VTLSNFANFQRHGASRGLSATGEVLAQSGNVVLSPSPCYTMCYCITATKRVRQQQTIMVLGVQAQ